jgi:hypothetical protein
MPAFSENGTSLAFSFDSKNYKKYTAWCLEPTSSDVSIFPRRPTRFLHCRRKHQQTRHKHVGSLFRQKVSKAAIELILLHSDAFSRRRTLVVPSDELASTCSVFGHCTNKLFFCFNVSNRLGFIQSHIATRPCRWIYFETLVRFSTRVNWSFLVHCHIFLFVVRFE